MPTGRHNGTNLLYSWNLSGEGEALLASLAGLAVLPHRAVPRQDRVEISLGCARVLQEAGLH